MGQPGRMGVVATPKYKEVAYWTHKEKEELEGSDEKCFDHHAIYIGYNVESAFYSARKVGKRVLRLTPRTFLQLHSMQNWNMPLCKQN